MSKFDGKAFGERIVRMVKEYVEPVRAQNAQLLEANAALVGRLTELEGKLIAVTPKSALIDRSGVLILTLGDGSVKELGQVVGPAADPAALRPIVAELVEHQVKSLPAPLAPKALTVEDLRPMVLGLVDQAVVAEVEKHPPRSLAPEDLRPLVGQVVTEAVAALPAPKDGRTLEPAELRPIVAELVDAAIERLPAPSIPAETLKGLYKAEDLRAIAERVVTEAMKAQPAPPAPKALTVEDLRPLVGQVVEASLEDLPHQIAAEVATAVKALPPPAAGKDADLAEVARLVDAGVEKGLGRVPPLLEELVDTAIAARPEPKAPTPEDLRPLVGQVVESEVERQVKALPPAKDGRGIVSTLVDEAGDLVIAYSDGQSQRAGRVKGAPGDSIEALELEAPDGGRSLVFRAKAGARTLEAKARTAVWVDRGVWRPGDYEQGDGVTYKGSYWLAERDKPARPGEDGSGWRLAVKRGRDGRDAGGKWKQPPAIGAP